MKPQIAIDRTELTFKTSNIQIDYFEIPFNYLTQIGFNTKHQELNLKPDEYLEIDKNLTIDITEKETIALNVQVGKGKTTAFYKLVEKHVKAGHKVIMLSPFKKLVDKDFNAITANKISVFSYTELNDEADEAKFLDCDVQIMTINCLLQNPGDDQFAQKFTKRNYLEQLISSYKENNEKVVFFFDEIHESIHNFKTQYIPNLQRWVDLVHKAYISSATFTPASIPVIEYVGLLTNKKINIIEIPRTKTTNQSDLYLHLTSIQYGSSELSPLRIIEDIINSNSSKKINILTTYKSLAKALVNNKNDSSIVKAIQSLNPNITIGDDDNTFNDAENNIGTTFKTGIDISQKDAILIIIFPTLIDNNYGIFSDGLPSIIQAVARVRNKGQVHIIMPYPDAYIYFTTEDMENPLITNVPLIKYSKQNHAFFDLKNSFDISYNARKEEINQLESLSKYNIQLKYNYPSFEESLIESLQIKFPSANYSYGKNLSPYTLWAALNNQFTNLKLAKITLTFRKTNRVPINQSKAVEEVKKFVHGDCILNIHSYSYYDAIEAIKQSIEELTEGTDTKFIYSNGSYSPKDIYQCPFLVKTLGQIYLQEITIKYQLDKIDYILSCTDEPNKSSATDKRHYTYDRLSSIRDRFITELDQLIIQNNKNENLVDKDVYLNIKDSTYFAINSLFTDLNKYDRLIKKKTFSLSYYDIKQNEPIPSSIKESLFKEMEKCFTNVTSKKKSFENKKDQYYLVSGKLQRTLTPILSGVLIL